jgi:coenzyme PQQ precursor peptide PqqA
MGPRAQNWKPLTRSQVLYSKSLVATPGRGNYSQAAQRSPKPLTPRLVCAAIALPAAALQQDHRGRYNKISLAKFFSRASLVAKGGSRPFARRAKMAWKTPKIVEVSVGMEINMYACAARK